MEKEREWRKCVKREFLCVCVSCVCARARETRELERRRRFLLWILVVNFCGRSGVVISVIFWVIFLIFLVGGGEEEGGLIVRGEKKWRRGDTLEWRWITQQAASMRSSGQLTTFSETETPSSLSSSTKRFRMEPKPIYGEKMAHVRRRRRRRRRRNNNNNKTPA